MTYSLARFVISCLIASATLFGCSDDTPLPFNSAEWKSGDRYLRGRMTGHLRNDSLLIGKSKSEILEMLGPSEDDSDLTRLN
ncbi:MAG: hypothetical protein ACKVOK_07590, partial [Flavobacteriales bacterium]